MDGGCRCDIVLMFLLKWHCRLFLSSFTLTEDSGIDFFLSPRVELLSSTFSLRLLSFVGFSCSICLVFACTGSRPCWLHDGNLYSAEKECMSAFNIPTCTTAMHRPQSRQRLLEEPGWGFFFYYYYSQWDVGPHRFHHISLPIATQCVWVSSLLLHYVPVYSHPFLKNIDISQRSSTSSRLLSNWFHPL